MLPTHPPATSHAVNVADMADVADVDAAIARVLDAEAVARQQIDDARAEAAQMIEQARAAIRALDERTERRIRAVRAAFERRCAAAVAALDREGDELSTEHPLTAAELQAVQAAVDAHAAVLAVGAP